jgi:hypothetical protein
VNIQELINKLMEIEDKTKEVVIEDDYTVNEIKVMNNLVCLLK